MAQTLRISEGASIAVHALIHLAEKNGMPVSNAAIAEAFRVSANHSSKVMQRLLKSGFVQAVRGPGGGYTLAREPKDVSLLEIYRAIDGEPANTGCLFGRGKHCSLSTCLFAGLIRDTEELVEKHLGSVTLADYMALNIGLEEK
ncbi:MAG TPA: Rrf2 family transcriptional regulator [Candidatus Sabulitectum sp.]|mgnify:FL=1|nr:Rrf2 family transcriptional regulator [Candidatus Sabulitectum sp.]HPF31576.1 Rrf2 family transcriptional regulator [Candidatus Sabulitectum sp.]HPJ27657.1 Rrf2 family transcriptional regulator [Candidatus Sabulitectum sp.]HPR21366.1 Rrf2 family transcriptional regulator [Candidatus Sabulitectum sp.]